MNTFQKDAICIAALWHYADLAAFEKYNVSRQLTVRRLRSVGLDLNDAGAIAEAYNELVLDVAAEIAPELSETHDYWGAKCLYPSPGWNAPKSGTTMAGDRSDLFLPSVQYADVVSTIQHRANGIL